MAETSNIRDLDARMAERRVRGTTIRELGPSARDREGALKSEQPFLSPSGWLIAVFLNVALLILVGLSVVLVPPLLSCRERSAQGFFAGDSFQACASRGISARFQDLDGRFRRIVLRSGQ